MPSIFEQAWQENEGDFEDVMAGSVILLPMIKPPNGREQHDPDRRLVPFSGIIDEEFPEAKLPGEDVTSRIRRYGNVTVLHARVSQLEGVAIRKADIIINNDSNDKPRYTVDRVYPDGLTWFYATLTRIGSET